MHTPENIAAVAESACEAPSTSIRHRSQQLNISETSLRRILHKDFGMPPYKVQLVPELKPIDLAMRFRFAKWACGKPARIHWKADAPKTSHCLVRILVQRHNRAIFLRKWERRGRYSQWRSLSGHFEGLFVHQNWRGGYWQLLVSTGRRYMSHSRSYTRCFLPCFWRSLYQSQSWRRLATLELQFNTVGLLFVGCRQR